MKIDQKQRKTVLFAVFICIIGLIFAACSNGSTDSKVIEAKYRFTDGNWREDSSTSNWLATVGKNTITTTDAGINLTGVYTSGGGKASQSGASGTWAYLYDDSGKIGIAVIWVGSMKAIVLGKFAIEEFYQLSYFKSLKISDMKDTYFGSGEFDL